MLSRVDTRVGILPNTGSGNWLVYVWTLMVTVAVWLGPFQRLLSCDVGTGLRKK